MNGTIFSTFRKQVDGNGLTQIGNLFSPELKAEIQTKSTKLLAATYNVLSSPHARTCLTIAVMILVCATESFGQTASKDLKEVIKGFKDFLYNDVRFAICVIGFAFGAIGLIFSKNPDTRKQALFAFGGAAVFAFGPGLLKFIADQTGTANPQ